LPGRFDKYFKCFGELGEIVAAAGSGAPHLAKIGELSARYKSSYVNAEWIPELKAKYNLELTTK
jgi:hypothetical protein